MEKGKLELTRYVRDGSVVICVTVRGNVGDAGRAVLDRLGMLPRINIANCREKYVSDAADLDALRNALLTAGIVDGPKAVRS